jgi:hypothetical protein
MLKDELKDFFGLPLWLLSFGIVGGALLGTGLSLEQLLIVSAFIGAPRDISAGGTFLTLYFTSVVLTYLLLYLILGMVRSLLTHTSR